MKFRAFAHQRGFSLIEMVIVIFLFSIILVALFTLYDRHSTIYNYEQGMVKTAGGGRTALNEITSFGQQAHHVMAAQVVNGVNYASGANTLVLQLPSANSSGSIIVGAWDYVAFYVSGTKLWETVQADPASFRKTGNKLLTDSLQGITFTYDNGNYSLVKKVSVDLQSQTTVHAELISSHLEQQIYLRNYY